MRRAALGILIGITSLQQLSNLPSLFWSWVLLLTSLMTLWVVLLYLHKRSYVGSHVNADVRAGITVSALLPSTLIKILAVVLLSASIGFSWASIAGHQLLAGGLPSALEGQDVIVEGVIASLPEPAAMSPSKGQSRSRFHFVPDSLHWQGEPQPLPTKLLLSWYQNPPILHAGERWRLKVRLKRPHGFMNPGGFDYEAWLFQQGIRAKGYVRVPGKRNRAENINQRLAPAASAYPVHQLREGLRARIQAALQQHPLSGIVLALAIGDRQLIDRDQWQVLMRTGTNHLVAISGLHVGLVAGFAFFLMRRLWRTSASLVNRWPAAKAGAIAALLAAAIYALLAGFSVPTQRALVMVAVVMLAVLLQRQTRPSSMLALAMILVLGIDPLAVLSPGFWLSFGAVAVILYGMSGRLAMRSAWWKWGRVQWLVAVGLFPALVLLFQKASIVAPLANLLAVPWVSLVTVPLTLLGSLLLGVLPVVGEWLLGLSLWSLDGLWWWLEMLSQWSFAQWQQAAPVGWALGVSLLGIAWLLAPRGVPARWVGAVWLLPLVFVSPVSLPQGEARFTLLDVGQGLATVVQTQNHVLVFDAGPRFSSGFNTGEVVVAPYLLAQGRNYIDTLIVSHADNDHIGGVASLLASLPVQQVLSSEPQKILGAKAQACKVGQQWQWDGVQFEMLSPVQGLYTGRRKRNNSSCVLRIQAGKHSVLLTGDIERAAEQEITQRLAEKLKSDVLVVPHHGSKTSSSVAFVASVAPDIALFPVGYRNRYGFPKNDVVQRYRDRNIRLFDTANHGAIEILLGGETGLNRIASFRQQAARYWHQRPLNDQDTVLPTTAKRATSSPVTTNLVTTSLVTTETVSAANASGRSVTLLK